MLYSTFYAQCPLRISYVIDGLQIVSQVANHINESMKEGVRIPITVLCFITVTS